MPRKRLDAGTADNPLPEQHAKSTKTDKVTTKNADASRKLTVPVYASESDVPDQQKGSLVLIESDGRLAVERSD